MYCKKRYFFRQYYGYQESGGGGGPGSGATAGGPAVVDYQPPPPPPGEYPLPPYYGGYPPPPPPPPPPPNPAYLHSQGRPFVDREYLFIKLYERNHLHKISCWINFVIFFYKVDINYQNLRLIWNYLLLFNCGVKKNRRKDKIYLSTIKLNLLPIELFSNWS